ncbi:MAG TPA: protein-L-isoaspartate(D-aspartate) O-methyltransferase [Gammaproteobacteria bacterium]|nr:protein-L-isoaspartate(D-aspartate) O-methyltransferase [Gammaproteobacteria bacterium]
MKYLARYCFLFLSLLGGQTLADAGNEYRQQRAQLIRSIEQTVRETSDYLDSDKLDPRVMQAMARVPRHEFVPAAERRYAYENRPLPIGYGQTISQPYIVAIMTDLLKPGPGDRVLEIGTGSGYQAAILAELVSQVYSIEIISGLARRARDVLDQLGYKQVRTRVGDGYYGWQEQAPFDAIIVTAAADHVPPPLIRQLKPGGRMLIPVGSRFMTQQLILVTKGDDGITTRLLMPVRFVPLTGEH